MIIETLLDNDLYKFTMQQAILHNYSGAIVRYKFVCRNKNITFTEEEVEQIKEEVKNLCCLSFSNAEIIYLCDFEYFKNDYIDFLRYFKLSYDDIFIQLDNNGMLKIDIQGSWIDTILFEVPVLAIVNEVYNRKFKNKKGIILLKDKIKFLKENDKEKNIKIIEFGTRRRFSKEWQTYIFDLILGELYPRIIGTSNLDLDRRFKQYEIKPFGTMAHEWLQAHQAFTNLRNSQKMALDTWVKEYRGYLGIALTDVIGVNSFIEDFDLYLAKIYDGVRHDSGNPYLFADKIIKMYENLGIDPKTKSITFSDSLDFQKIVKLNNFCKGLINVNFGIGTYLTNDVGIKPLNIVIKMTKCNGQDVSKISDSPNKSICENKQYITYLKGIFKE